MNRPLKIKRWNDFPSSRPLFEKSEDGGKTWKAYEPHGMNTRGYLDITGDTSYPEEGEPDERSN